MSTSRERFGTVAPPAALLATVFLIGPAILLDDPSHQISRLIVLVELPVVASLWLAPVWLRWLGILVDGLLALGTTLFAAIALLSKPSPLAGSMTLNPDFGAVGALSAIVYLAIYVFLIYRSPRDRVGMTLGTVGLLIGGCLTLAVVGGLLTRTSG